MDIISILFGVCLAIWQWLSSLHISFWIGLVAVSIIGYFMDRFDRIEKQLKELALTSTAVKKGINDLKSAVEMLDTEELERSINEVKGDIADLQSTVEMLDFGQK